MDALFLSRLQFALTACFHFLFVPLTLGLSFLVAIMETRYVRTGDEEYRRMARFWGRLFLVNFAIGVVTGISLEFQFGTNWSGYSRFVGDVFGSLLAIEALAAFFLESTFIAVWMFGWKRLSPRLHALSIWVVACASAVSAFWILCANAWMQHPVGYIIRKAGDGGELRAELDDFLAVVTQEAAITAFLHVMMGAFILTGFFVMGISAFHLLRSQHTAFFQKSFRFGLWTALIFSLLEVPTGHLSGTGVAKRQPEKLAAMESLWKGGPRAPLALIVIPDEKNERNLVEICRVPSFLSLLAYGRGDAPVQGLLDFPKADRPPVTLVFPAFRLMVALGFLFPVLAILAWLWRNRLEKHRLFLRLLVWAIPLPYVALQAGWIVTELGRQPWIVYRMMRTNETVSPVPPGQVAVSLVAFGLVYSFLGLAAFFLLARFARRGPDPATETPEPETP